MRSSKSSTPSAIPSIAKPQPTAASARRRGMAYLVAVLAELRDDALEHANRERDELEHHFRDNLRWA